MKNLIFGILILGLAACGDDGHSHSHTEDGGHSHGPGPHGGTIVELGNHEAHIEVILDHDGGTIDLYVFDAELKPMAADAAPLLNLRTGAGPRQLTSKKGSEDESHWTWKDEAITGESVHDGARLRLKIGGKTFSPDLPHGH